MQHKNRTYKSGDKFEFSIDAAWTYTMQTNRDISGLRIVSNKDVVVSIGRIVSNNDVAVSLWRDSSDYLAYSPLPATYTWGTTHILLLNSQGGGVIRVIGRCLL